MVYGSVNYDGVNSLLNSYFLLTRKFLEYIGRVLQSDQMI